MSISSTCNHCKTNAPFPANVPETMRLMSATDAALDQAREAGDTAPETVSAFIIRNAQSYLRDGYGDNAARRFWKKLTRIAKSEPDTLAGYVERYLKEVTIPIRRPMPKDMGGAQA